MSVFLFAALGIAAVALDYYGRRARHGSPRIADPDDTVGSFYRVLGRSTVLHRNVRQYDT